MSPVLNFFDVSLDVVWIAVKITLIRAKWSKAPLTCVIVTLMSAVMD
jgi:hypothetical protein